MNVEQLAIRGVVRASPRTKFARHWDWYRSDALLHYLPPDWQSTVGTMHTGRRGHIGGIFCDTGPNVVTCVAGRVALVVVDLRVGSPTFGRWIPEDLDTADRVTIVIPGDVGWGFQTATWDAALMSLHDESQRRPPIDPRDARLEIMWPLSGGGGHQGIPLAEALPLLPDFTPE